VFHNRFPYQWPDGWYHRYASGPNGAIQLVQAAGESKLTTSDKWELVLTSEYHGFLKHMKFISADPKFCYEGHFFSSRASRFKNESACFPVDVSFYRSNRNQQSTPPGIFVGSRELTKAEESVRKSGVQSLTY
jgi:hypothetical protein